MDFLWNVMFAPVIGVLCIVEAITLWRAARLVRAGQYGGRLAVGDAASLLLTGLATHTWMRPPEKTGAAAMLVVALVWAASTAILRFSSSARGSR